MSRIGLVGGTKFSTRHFPSDRFRVPLMIVVANRLSKAYGEGANLVRALDQMDLRVNESERVALVGKSGSGKTTLLNLLAGLDSPTSGELVVGGQALSGMNSRQLASYRCRTIGVVFQSFQLLGHCSAQQNVELPLMLQGISPKQRRQLALAALDRVGLDRRAKHLPHELSGGEQQRVAVARAIVHRPGLLLADEPTGNLDSRTAAQVMSLILEVVAETQAALILITHDSRLAVEAATRVLTMRDGRIGDEDEA